MDTCEDDAYCDTGTDGGGGGGGAPSAPVCKPRAGNGQPCQDQGGCADGQLCGNGKCYKLSPTGGACNPSLQFSCLEYDEWCDPASSKCVKLPASGQPCGMTGRHCRLYASCEGGTCTNRPSEGEPCGDMGPQCLGDLQCDGGACAKRPAVRVCVEADPPPMGGGGGMGGM
jgi:hypothetical protein